MADSDSDSDAPYPCHLSHPFPFPRRLALAPPLSAQRLSAMRSTLPENATEGSQYASREDSMALSGCVDQPDPSGLPQLRPQNRRRNMITRSTREMPVPTVNSTGQTPVQVVSSDCSSPLPPHSKISLKKAATAEASSPINTELPSVVYDFENDSPPKTRTLRNTSASIKPPVTPAADPFQSTRTLRHRNRSGLAAVGSRANAGANSTYVSPSDTSVLQLQFNLPKRTPVIVAAKALPGKPSLHAQCPSTPLNPSPQIDPSEMPNESTEHEDVPLVITHGGGADHVYMIGAGTGSYSKTLDDDGTIPCEAITAITHLRRAQDFAAINETLDDHPSHNGLHQSPAQREVWQKDMLHRNVLRLIKRQIRNGASLTLQRFDFSLTPSRSKEGCAHPLCKRPSHPATRGPFYLVLSSLDSAETNMPPFCLRCVEDLWNVQDILSPYPTPEVYDVPRLFSLENVVSEMNLDGQDDRDLPPDINTDCSIQASSSCQSSIGTPGPLYTSPTCAESLSAECGSAEAWDLTTTKQFHAVDQMAPPQVIKRRLNKLPAASSTRQSARIRVQSYRSQSAQSEHSLPVKLGNPSRVKALRVRSLNELDAVVKTAKSAETRLARLYERRGQVLAALAPGESASVELNKGKRINPRKVSRDIFGVPYTDLLTEPVSYWKQINTRERSASTRKTSNYVDPTEPVTSEFSCQHFGQWCNCIHGNNRADRVLCANKDCLTGFHTIDSSNEDDGIFEGMINRYGGFTGKHCADISKDGWICSMCKSHVPRPMPSPFMTNNTIESLFPPSYSGFPPYKLNTLLDSGIPQHDGPASQGEFADIPLSLLQSKHAHIPGEHDNKIERTEISSNQEGPRIPSPTGSMNSDRQWRQPPTGFQHLAAFICPGPSLNEKETAALKMWKLASQEQLNWETLQKRNKARERLLNGELEDESFMDCTAIEENRGKMENRVDPSEEEKMADIAGVTIKECRGKDLTTIFAMVAQRENQAHDSATA